MKCLEWISLLSCNAGALLGFILLKVRCRHMDASGFAGLGEAIIFIAIVFAFAVVGASAGAMAYMSGISTLPVIISVIINISVVLIVAGVVLWSFLKYRY